MLTTSQTPQWQRAPSMGQLERHWASLLPSDLLLRIWTLLGRSWRPTPGHRLPVLHLHPYRRLPAVLRSNAPAITTVVDALLSPSSLASSRSILQMTTCIPTQAIPVNAERFFLEGSVAERLLRSTSRTMLHVNNSATPGAERHTVKDLHMQPAPGGRGAITFSSSSRHIQQKPQYFFPTSLPSHPVTTLMYPTQSTQRITPTSSYSMNHLPARP